jgi:hypothetical protein
MIHVRKDFMQLRPQEFVNNVILNARRAQNLLIIVLSVQFPRDQRLLTANVRQQL